MSKKVKIEHPTYGIKTEPLEQFQGYEERLMSWTEPDEPKSTCQICNHHIRIDNDPNYPNHLCKVCDKTFEFDKQSNIQKKRKRTAIKYQCDECLKSFSNVNTYQRHIKCHDEKKPYRCRQCQMRFYHSKDLSEHMEIHENSFSFSSSVPTIESVTNSNFSVELKDETCPNIKLEIEDPVCNNYESQDDNVQSINSKSFNPQPTPVAPYEPKHIYQSCTGGDDDLPMVQIENFEWFDKEREIETVAMATFYEGSNSSTLTATSGIADDSIVKIEAEAIQSPAGYEVFSVDTEETTEFELLKEEISESTGVAHPDRMNDGTQRDCYICKHCNKDFMYYGNYAKHLDQHAIGKLMCNFCDQKRMFSSTDQIRKHIRDYHSNQEMFDCSVCFTTLPKHYFASHMRTHRSDEKTLTCKYCNSRFHEPSELFYHFKNRHSDLTQLKQPIQPIEDVTTTGVKKYECKYCSAMFVDVIQMYHHTCKVHVKHTAAAAKRMRRVEVVGSNYGS